MSNFATVMETTPQPHLRLTALRAAFPYTVPIFAGFWFMGLAYGLLMSKSGFAFYWPMLMAMTIFSGSVEFVAVKLLLGSFQPLQSFLIALFICARHLFYGISMLDKFKGMGWKKTAAHLCHVRRDILSKLYGTHSPRRGPWLVHALGDSA